MDSTTESVTTETKTYKEGELIKGKDFIRLEAPLILPSKSTPLLTKAQDLAGAINELKKGLDEGGGDDWSPPSDWPEVPKPLDYEICLLVSIDDYYGIKQAAVHMARPADGYTGYGNVTVDWGDGTIESWEGYNDNNTGTPWPAPLNHTYAANGLYVVKVTTTEQSCCLYGYYSLANWLMAKLGSEITIYSNGSGYGFYEQNRLQYVKMSGKGGLTKRSFYNCYALKKIDIAIPPKTIPEDAFTNCRSLKSFDFSAVTEMNGSCMSNAGFTHVDMPLCTAITYMQYCYNLKSVAAPLCASVGANAFTNCYALETVEFAEGCTFGNNAFSNCYSLYPYPNV